MGPIVFCASFMPWLRAMNAALRIWPLPKVKFTVTGRHWCSAHKRRPITRKLQKNPTHGEEIMGTITLCSMVPKLITERLPPAEATPAPHRPPIKAWLELDGSPNHHVRRFQIMPPMSPPKIVVSVMNSAFTRPVAIVVATAVPQKAPTNSKTAASAIPWLGVRTFVAVTVAMEFAASWKPLINSKINATTITNNANASAEVISGMFQNDVEDDIAGVAAAIENFLQQFVEIFKHHRRDRIVFSSVKVTQHFEHQFVSIAFDPLEGVVEVLHAVEIGFLAQRLNHLKERLRDLIHHREMPVEIDFAQARRAKDVALGEFLDDLGDFVERV